MFHRSRNFKISVAPLRRFASSFRINTSGSVAIGMGAVTFAAFTAVGMAVDYANAVSQRSDVQRAVDIAVLSAGGSGETSEAAMRAHADKIFETNYAEPNGTSVTTNFNQSGSTISYHANVEVPTTLLNLIGVSHISVGGEAQVSRRVEATEIVLAVDATASMGFGSSWDDAKDALGDLLTDLDALAATQADFHATFVPFADRVNLGTERAKQWLSVPEPDHHDWGRRSGSNTHKGCLEPREETLAGNDYALTDKAPSVLGFLPTAENHYVSWFADNKSYFECPESEVVGPTTDMSLIADAIEDIRLKGTGRLDIPMAWAHRLLSPNWKNLWDVPGYPGEHAVTRKIAILVTDMRTMGFHYEVPHRVDESHNTPNFGWNKGTPQGFANIVETCDRLKADGIEVHTIYVNGNTHGVQYMKDCSTAEVGYYHNVLDITDLRVALRSITRSLVDVSLLH